MRELSAGRSRLPRNARARLFVTFLNRFVYFMLTPLMAVTFARDFGAARAGFLLAVIVVVTMAATFVGGHLSDSRGRRPVLLGSELGVVVAFAGITLAHSALLHSPVLTYCCFLLSSVMSGLGYPANDAAMMDVATPETRVAIYTASYWLSNLGFALGAAVGGALYAAHFFLLAVIGLVLAVVCWLTTLVAVTETRVAVPSARDGRLLSGVRAAALGYRQSITDRPYLQLLAAAVLITAIEMQLTYYLGIQLAHDFRPQELFQIGWWRLQLDGVGMLSTLRILNAALVVILAVVLRRLTAKLSDGVLLYGGLGLFVAGFVGLAVTRDPWPLIALTVVFTVGELLNVPIRQVLLAEVVDPAKRATYMALYGLRPRLAALLASFSVVLGAFLPPVAMGGSFALMGAAAAVLIRRTADSVRQRSERTALPSGDARATLGTS